MPITPPGMEDAGVAALQNPVRVDLVGYHYQSIRQPNILAGSLSPYAMYMQDW